MLIARLHLDWALSCQAARDRGVPLLLAVTPEGGHSLTWPEGWAAERAWACDVVVEWVHAVAAATGGDTHLKQRATAVGMR